MRYNVAVEDIEDDHWVAWVLALPGCYSSATTMKKAVARVPDSITAYFRWLSRYDHPSKLANEPVEVQVVEVFRSYITREDPDYRVNAFFEDDSRPLIRSEVDLALVKFDCARRDLMERMGDMSGDIRVQTIPGERFGSINGILLHIATAEWWYLDRLGLGLDFGTLPMNPFSRLEKVRDNTVRCLPELVGDDRIVTRVGEKWSARKVVRRALWHERDHTQHIARHLQTHKHEGDR